MRKQYYIRYLIGLTLLMYSCKTTQKSTVKEVSAVYTDVYKYNLKEPIKQMRSFLTMNTDSLPRERQLFYNTIADLKRGWQGFFSFDRNGLLNKYSSLSDSIDTRLVDTIPPRKNNIYIYI